MSDWVGDSLIEILGLSDQTTKQYLISMAKDAKSEQQLASRIIEDGLLDGTEKVQNFITKLYAEFGRKPVIV